MTSIGRAAAALVLVLVAAAPAAARCDELWGAAMADDVAAIAKVINAGEPVTVAPTDVDTVARMKLESARVALTARDHESAGKAVLEVIRMSGASELRRAQAFTIACDLGMRARDWELAKVMCEKVLGIAGASEGDRVWATETLKALRKQAPGLFKR